MRPAKILKKNVQVTGNLHNHRFVESNYSSEVSIRTMSNLNNSKLSKFLSSKGFYIALAICVVGAGAAAWVAIDTTMNPVSTASDPTSEKKIEDIASEHETEESTADWDFASLNDAQSDTSKSAEPVETKLEDILMESAAEDKSPASSESAETSASSESAQEVFGRREKSQNSSGSSAEQQPLAYSLPILSELFNPYSNGELVKNKTLGDWRTHDGIDLKAEKGTDVMACADGRISRIHDDALWGTCMEIEHAGGLTSIYCGLDKSSLTHQVGDKVSIKDVIGKVDKVPCEISLDNHLHFALKKDGKWVDPVSTMGLA